MSIVKADEVGRFIVSHLVNSFKENGVTEKDITDDFDLMKRGIIDSIGLIQLFAAIEDRFGIEVDFEEMDTDNLTVLGSICKYIEERAK
ncbi:acyl carrier protein [Candidatus Deferrimicrobium sp.]|uniref:acyl carrier protein n=1 Tax=Candidatus Deferrimicrobium sp. TaxID=3060586 RepID=UPI003C3A7BEE